MLNINSPCFWSSRHALTSSISNVTIPVSHPFGQLPILDVHLIWTASSISIVDRARSMWCNIVHFDGHLSNFESALHENDHNPPQQSYNQHNDQELIQYTPYCPRYLYSLFGDILRYYWTSSKLDLPQPQPLARLILRLAFAFFCDLHVMHSKKYMYCIAPWIHM